MMILQKLTLQARIIQKLIKGLATIFTQKERENKSEKGALHSISFDRSQKLWAMYWIFF